MVSHTWLLSGIPRSGTSLCCRLAGGLPDTVALSEPMHRQAFEGVESPIEACLRVEEFARSVRFRISVEGRAPSVQVAGRLDDDRVAGWDRAEGLRRPRGGQGEILIDKPLSSGFELLIKHNALFTALLPRLVTSMATLALVRNPLAVLASWQTVDLPVQRGRIPAGEQFDDALRRRLDNEPLALRRQVVILNWFFRRFAAYLEPDNVIRYEDLVNSSGRALFRLLGQGSGHAVELENRNGNRFYQGMEVDSLLRALEKESGAWSKFYSLADCERVADMIRSVG